MGRAMLARDIILLVIAIAAGVLGFSGFMGTSAWLAYGPFVVFSIIFLVFLFMGAAAGRRHTMKNESGKNDSFKRPHPR